MRILLLLCAVWAGTKAEDAEAVVTEAEKDKKSLAPSTRFIGAAALAPAALGFGAGIVGSLLVGKLLEEKERNKCGQAPFRGRRDNTQTRFLPGLFGGGKKCPPSFNQQSGYQQPQPNGYQPPRQNGYQPPRQNGYQPPHQNGYQPPRQNGYQPAKPIGYQPANGYQPAQQQGYQPQTSNYHQPQNQVYHQPTSGYQQPSSVYHQPTSGYQQPTSGLILPSPGYHQPSASYHQPTPCYQTSSSVYQHANPGYAREQHQHNQFSATNTYSPTVAPHVTTNHNSGSNFGGIIARKLPKEDDSKVNFG